MSLFTPTNIAITVAFLVAQAVPVLGEIADAGLVLYGGWQAFQGGGDLGRFALTAVTAQSDSDLRLAGHHFARAVLEIGAAAFVASVLNRGGKARLGKAAEPELANLKWKIEEGSVGPDFPGTTVPQGFTITVGEQQFRITANACKHMSERIASSKGIPNPWGDGLGLPRSPWQQIGQNEYPISSLASALEEAASRLRNLPPNRHPLTVDNWELGIDTVDSPWAVYHARPLTQ
jgi:hypothetical protein